jgi:ABC-type phosphate/phosphonate transport system substrate-binding protein
VRLTASLPMYTSAAASTEALWTYLGTKLQQAGVPDVPAALTWPKELHTHWKDPDLLLSQACGYPLVTELQQQVRVVGVFHYNAAGCSGEKCRSVLIARASDPGVDLAAFRGRRVAYNSADSQSGYNSLRSLIAPLAQSGRFFSQHHVSGSHLASIEMVRDGLADIAAIDCVTLAGLELHSPEVTRGIRVVGYSEPYPGLPLITSCTTSETTVATLQAVLTEASRDHALSKVLKDLLITGFEPLHYADYEVCMSMQKTAFALGCREL